MTNRTYEVIQPGLLSVHIEDQSFTVEGGTIRLPPHLVDEAVAQGIIADPNPKPEAKAEQVVLYTILPDGTRVEENGQGEPDVVFGVSADEAKAEAKRLKDEAKAEEKRLKDEAKAEAKRLKDEAKATHAAGAPAGDLGRSGNDQTVDTADQEPKG